MRRILWVPIFFLPGLLLLLFSAAPKLDATVVAPLPHFYVVTFVTVTAAVVSMLLSASIENIARPRHFLAAGAFFLMGTIFFTHGLATPGAVSATIHPALQWSAWLTLFSGSLLFLLASFDRPDGAPDWLQIRTIRTVALVSLLLYLAILLFIPELLTSLNENVAPFHQQAAFWSTLLLWLTAAVRLGLIWRQSGQRVDGTLTFSALWLAFATISMHHFPVWQLSWWLYHFILLAAFLTVFYVLISEYEQARQFRLLPYFIVISLSIAALLALLASFLFAEFAREILGSMEQGPEMEQAILEARRTGLFIAFGTMSALLVGLLVVIRRADGIISTRSAELARAYRDLQQSEEMRREMTDMIVHDLRNPLTAISGSLDAIIQIGDQMPVDKRKRFLNNAYNAGQRMTGLVNDILDVSKIESGELQLQPVQVAIPELIDRHLAIFSELAAESGVALKHNCPADLKAVLDPDLIGRVIENLVSNGLKYSDTGGAVQLSAWKDEEKLHLRIDDNGPGIPDEFKQRIFDKFIRVPEKTGGSLRKGTGLGLTFCRLVVEAHDGRIWVEDGPGGGSSFNVTIPN